MIYTRLKSDRTYVNYDRSLERPSGLHTVINTYNECGHFLVGREDLDYCFNLQFKTDVALPEKSIRTVENRFSQGINQNE